MFCGPCAVQRIGGRYGEKVGTDPEVAGLCISRGQSFVFRYGLNGGQWDRQIKAWRRWRDLAKRSQKPGLNAGCCDAGEDPAALGSGKTYKTLVDLAHDFIELHARPRKRSWKNDESYFRLHLLRSPVRHLAAARH